MIAASGASVMLTIDGNNVALEAPGMPQSVMDITGYIQPTILIKVNGSVADIFTFNRTTLPAGNYIRKQYSGVVTGELTVQPDYIISNNQAAVANPNAGLPPGASTSPPIARAGLSLPLVGVLVAGAAAILYGLTRKKR